ncbi:hypothetical protein PV620_30090 [Streptomyces sp. ME02-6978a]|uniref:hypothetical protein n=1 Tax=unclassified Streptomyces TaxID=2593676 RepID=UPI0029B0C61E|nr:MULTISPECIES: hypothetical protein [unclassified Streptomyces]MDX3087155.1 hypothetical protein [Streptomyces sp. ME12-02E]MDX3335798.1 hypothetical protein [Streptomyces sp. ME02-6978a]
MSELPTAATPPTTQQVALASIEAAKLTAGQDVIDCLDAIGDLIRITGQPDAVFDWVRDTLNREELHCLATRHRITLHESRAADEELLPRTTVIWTVGGEGMALYPAGQRPAATLLQLREEIAQRQEDVQRAADFQATVAAGHLEDLDTWHARTGKGRP